MHPSAMSCTVMWACLLHHCIMIYPHSEREKQWIVHLTSTLASFCACPFAVCDVLQIAVYLCVLACTCYFCSRLESFSALYAEKSTIAWFWVAIVAPLQLYPSISLYYALITQTKFYQDLPTALLSVRNPLRYLICTKRAIWVLFFTFEGFYGFY